MIAELVAGSANTLEHTDVYDLEPGHSRGKTRASAVSRRRTRCTRFSTRSSAAKPVLGILKKLLGPGLARCMHGSKLNMKSAQSGSPVESAIRTGRSIRSTTTSVLAIGVLLDDCDLANGPMLVTPGTHNREV